MVGIPQCGASSHSKVTVLYGEPVHVPKGVVPFETAVGGDDVAALLDGGLACKDSHIVQMYVV